MSSYGLRFVYEMNIEEDLLILASFFLSSAFWDLSGLYNPGPGVIKV